LEVAIRLRDQKIRGMAKKKYHGNYSDGHKHWFWMERSLKIVPSERNHN
jgi:beta-lactamase class D